MIHVSFPAKYGPVCATVYFSLALLCMNCVGCGSSQDVEAVADKTAPNHKSSTQIAKQPEAPPNLIAEEKNEPDKEEEASTELVASEPAERKEANQKKPPKERTPSTAHYPQSEEHISVGPRVPDHLVAAMEKRNQEKKTAPEEEGSGEDEEVEREEAVADEEEEEEETLLSAEPEPSELSDDLSLETDGEQPFLLNGKQKSPEFSGEPQQPKNSKADEWKVVIRESWKDYLPDLGLRYINQTIEVVSTDPSKNRPIQFVLRGRADYIPEVPFEPSDSKLQAILKKLNEAGVKLVNQVEHVVDGKPEPPFTLSAYCSQLKREEALALLVNFPEIKRLTMIRNPNVTPAALSHIAQLPNLAELYLERTAVGDAGIAKLSKLQSLRKLDLSQTDVTDASFPTFVQLTNLETLSLQSTYLSEKLVQELKDKLLPNCHIDFSSIDIPKDYSEIEEQPFVLKSRQGYYATTAIRFGGPHVTDARLMDLRKYTGLNVVCIDGTRVNGEGLKYLKQHKLITCVIIRNSPLTDDGLKQLAEFRNLKYLVIEGGSMSDEGIEAFKKKKPDVEFVRLN